MDLFTVIVILVLCGAVVGLALKVMGWLQVPDPYPKILLWVSVLIVFVWLLRALHVIDWLAGLLKSVKV